VRWWGIPDSRLHQPGQASLGATRQNAEQQIEQRPLGKSHSVIEAQRSTSLGPTVFVMKSAEDRPRGDETELLNRANERRILAQR
jgi:hypothetical protein